MQFTTLVSIVFATLPLAVFGTGSHSTGTVCDTITSYQAGPFTTCAVPACLEIKPVTQHCGCSTIPTVTVPLTACPAFKCGATSYITAIEDCFPTSSPSSSSHSSTPTLTSTTSTSKSTSSTKSSSSGPSSTSSPSSTTPSSSSTSSSSSTHTTTPVTTPYANSTITKTKTEITTLTTCPASVTCTGQTVTYTSTEICPTTTCTCVLPQVTYTTTILPPDATTVTTKAGNTPPSPTTSARPSFSEASGAVGRFEAGVGAMGAVVLAFLGMM